MKITIYLPTKIFLQVSAEKIITEGENGSFTLLPRHVDFMLEAISNLGKINV